MGSQKDIKDIFKHRYPFKLKSERWSEIIFEFPNYYEVYETKRIKPEGRVKDFMDGILPFVSYLQSSNDIKRVKGLTYVNSTYNIVIFIKGNTLGGVINVYHNGLNFINYYCHYSTRNASFPKQYLKIRLCVCHYYKPMGIKKYELEQCPSNVYKIDQCVICLTNPSNIFYNPCLHFCVCSQCDDKGKFNKCPYCREKIEETIIIKKNLILKTYLFLNKLLKWIVIVLQKVKSP